MNIHEYQSKQLLCSFGVKVPESRIAKLDDDIEKLSTSLADQSWIVKAQVHAGGRGKAGGIIRVENRQNLASAVNQMLGTELITTQTAEIGLPINSVLIEEALEIQREIYIAMLVDRAKKRLAIIASAEGGMDIEQVAKETPEKIITTYIHPASGLQSNQIRSIAYQLNLQKDQIKELHVILSGIYDLFHAKDCSLIEINPLVVQKNGELIALDAKINFDENALFRHQDIVQLRDVSQEISSEADAKELGLNYVKLDGDIGCIVNGAGLAMATMDLIKHHGGEPANFLDVGGGVSQGKVSEAFKLVLSDKNVNAIFVNIFGGIVRCDLIAQGIIDALQDITLKVPVVVLLQGTNADEGKQLLQGISPNIIPASNLSEGAEQSIEQAKSR